MTSNELKEIGQNADVIIGALQDTIQSNMNSEMLKITISERKLHILAGILNSGVIIDMEGVRTINHAVQHESNRNIIEERIMEIIKDM